MTCRVERAVNGWFKSLVASAINPVFDMLGKSLLSTPRLDQMPRAAGLWQGSLVVANAVFVLFVLAGGLTLMGHQTVQASYTVKDIAPRLVIGVVAANISLLLIGHGIEFANGLSAGLLGQGVNPEEAAGQLKKIIVHAVNPVDVGAFVVLVVIWAVLLGLILTFIFVIRIMLTILLIAAAPLALMCHALPQTEGLAKLWWRAFAGVLAIQVAQALVFITAMKVVLTTDMITWFGVHTPRDQIDLWIAVCLLYILVRIPSWISRMVWQGGLRSSPLVRTARTVAMLLIFRGVFSKAKAGRSAAGRTRPSPSPQPARSASTAARPLPPPPPSPPPSASPDARPQAEPRWGRSEQRWTPPDPAGHERARRGRPEPGGTGEQQRWGNPGTTWTPPYAGDWRRASPPPRRPSPERRVWPPSGPPGSWKPPA